MNEELIKFIRKSLRITTSAFDDEISTLIEAALIDMEMQVFITPIRIMH